LKFFSLNLAKTLANFGNGGINPYEVLVAAELWMNRVHPAVYDPRISSTVIPVSGIVSCDLPFGVFDPNNLVVLDEPSLPPLVRNYLFSGNGIRFYVHPVDYFYLPEELKAKFPGRVRAVPSASTRTMFLIDDPIGVKASLPFFLGRFERKVPPKLAILGRQFSDLLSAIYQTSTSGSKSLLTMPLIIFAKFVHYREINTDKIKNLSWKMLFCFHCSL